jgi:hypothetical protein
VAAFCQIAQAIGDEIEFFCFHFTFINATARKGQLYLKAQPGCRSGTSIRFAGCRTDTVSQICNIHYLKLRIRRQTKMLSIGFAHHQY